MILNLPDGKAPVWSFGECGVSLTPSLPLLPGPLRPEVVVPVSVLSMHQLELFNNLTMSKQIIDVKLKFYC